MMKRTVILGMGNPILGDDSIGIRIARKLQKCNNSPYIDVKETNYSGIYVLDFLEGYDRAIIIDSIKTENGKVGTVYQLALDDIFSSPNFSTIHKIDINTALQIGKEMGLKLPDDVHIIAVEIDKNETFSEECSPEVERAIPEVEYSVYCLLDKCFCCDIEQD